MKKYFILATLLIGVLVGASTLSVIAQSSGWVAPTATPPGGNVPAPINVGSILQEKVGGLWIKSGLAVDGNLIIATGSPVTGKVLTAVDNTGLATWKNSEIGDIVDPYLTVVLCKSSDGWQCASKIGTARMINAQSPSKQTVFDPSVARINAEQACKQNGHDFVGYKYYIQPTSCGRIYHGVIYDGVGWPWQASNCGNSVPTINEIYCKEKPVVLPADLLN